MPEAGWYPDPADPGAERWWGGSEWSHDVRPLVAAPPAAAPQPLLNVPGGGINPFAELDAQEARQRALNPGPSPSAVQAPSFGYGAPQQFPMGSPTELYYPSTNGLATGGLVLSALCISIPGLVLSIVGLMRANAMAHRGERAIGRNRAIWGIALSFVSPFLVGVLLAITIPMLQAQQVSAVAEREGVSPSEVVVEVTGFPALYDKAEAEQIFIDAFADEGLTLDSVICPRIASMVVGGGFECSFIFQGRTHTSAIEWTTNRGEFIMFFDGVEVQQ